MNKPSYLRENEETCQCVTMGLEEVHNPIHECRVCGKCCADEPMLADRNSTSNDKGTCILCAMEEDPELTIQEVASIVG